jgi:predicted DNA-binding transcriptional regulator YafY
MARNKNQKLKILYLMQMLLRETDDEHGLTMAEIIDRLDELGIKAERKSVYDDMDALRKFGLDIINLKGSRAEYHIGNRDLEHAELTMLIDAVQSSKFLTERKSAALINKLKSLVSVHEAKQFDRRIFVAGRVKMQNESVLYNVDAIQRAIQSRRKLSFLYYDYDFEKKQVARKDGGRYTVNPVSLVYIDEFYYLVTYHDRYDDLVNYRADRMKKIEILGEPSSRMPKARHFDISEYCRRSFSMFGGEDIRVQLAFHRVLANAIIDRFGKDVRIEKIKGDDEYARAHVTIARSAPFFGWITQFGNMVEIEAPANLREEYAEFLEGILDTYYEP